MIVILEICNNSHHVAFVGDEKQAREVFTKLCEENGLTEYQDTPRDYPYTDGEDVDILFLDYETE